MIFHHIAITVNDLNKSLEFYSKYFGFLEEKRFKGDSEFVYLSLENIKLELWHFSESVKAQDSLTNLKIIGLRHIAFKIDGIKLKIQELNNAGFEFSEIQLGTSGVYYTLGTDPDGIAIELISDTAT